MQSACQSQNTEWLDCCQWDFVVPLFHFWIWKTSLLPAYHHIGLFIHVKFCCGCFGEYSQQICSNCRRPSWRRWLGYCSLCCFWLLSGQCLVSYAVERLLKMQSKRNKELILDAEHSLNFHSSERTVSFFEKENKLLLCFPLSANRQQNDGCLFVAFIVNESIFLLRYIKKKKILAPDPQHLNSCMNQQRKKIFSSYDSFSHFHASPRFHWMMKPLNKKYIIFICNNSLAFPSLPS